MWFNQSEGAASARPSRGCVCPILQLCSKICHKGSKYQSSFLIFKIQSLANVLVVTTDEIQQSETQTIGEVRCCRRRDTGTAVPILSKTGEAQ